MLFGPVHNHNSEILGNSDWDTSWKALIDYVFECREVALGSLLRRWVWWLWNIMEHDYGKFLAWGCRCQWLRWKAGETLKKRWVPTIDRVYSGGRQHLRTCCMRWMGLFVEFWGMAAGLNDGGFGGAWVTGGFGELRVLFVGHSVICKSTGINGKVGRSEDLGYFLFVILGFMWLAWGIVG